MAQQHSVAHTKNHLPALIHEVENGAQVEITRRGRSVAVLLSMAEYQRLRGERPDAWERLQQFRASHELSDLDVDEIFPVVRDRSPGREFSW